MCPSNHSLIISLGKGRENASHFENKYKQAWKGSEKRFIHSTVQAYVRRRMYGSKWGGPTIPQAEDLVVKL